ncbi:hypothetical protein BDB01DRAFT_846323 [Pilobolus umbonatus]|nr:hypothetical protein BDB01DRAFT_846323 [Pilobolus umbonatus]
MTYGALSWMWFYGFFFLAVIIAICCSIAATVKLVQEHRSLKERLTLIANDSPSRLLTITQNTEHIRNQSNAFSRVAIRSIIYPLVPFICNIWGFITQLKFVNKEMDVPEFSLSLIDTTFASLQGFFIALVFLSDPALMRMYEEKFKHLKQKYLEEFSHIHSYENGSIRIISIRKPDRLQEVIVDKTTNQPRNSVASSEGSIQRPQPIRIANHSVPPFISSPTMYDLENMFSPYYKVVSTPMRRVSISSSIYSQMSHSMHREDTPADDLPNSLSKNFIFRDPDQLNQVYIPYQYPRMANVFHFILSHICKEQ